MICRRPTSEATRLVYTALVRTLERRCGRPLEAEEHEDAEMAAEQIVGSAVMAACAWGTAHTFLADCGVALPEWGVARLDPHVAELLDLDARQISRALDCEVTRLQEGRSLNGPSH